ncbi:reverse transcriptase domain-containing protein [Tanacetum coccineum]|uniref:Reverse transcriptase domain-containing protein n=1 Tax=Tanacetum coccineum TaxID=301880 RepID=A0ABQ5DCT2_9ASTR
MAPGRRPIVNRNPPVNRSTNRNTPDINSGIDAQMLNQLIATRVAEALAAAAVTHAASTQEEFNLSNVAEGDRVKFASITLLDSALTWWNVYVHSVTLNAAHTTPWNDFKAMFIRKYCPRTNLTTYNQRFQELFLLCPKMVPNTDRLLERYIEGLPLNIKGNVTSSKPVDLHEAIEMAQGLMYQVVQELGENSGDKRKWNGNHYNNNNTNNVGNFNQNKRPETARVFTTGQSIYAGKLPFCGKCGRHHTDACPPTCHNCGRAGHKAKECRALPRPASQRGPGTQGGQGSDVTCFGCGEKGHYKNKCPNNGNQGRSNQIREAAVQDNNVVNGTFLINNVYASVLFDTGADRSFVSIDLLLIELGSFNVIIGMDWMLEQHAEVVCHEKYIRVPYGNDVLIIQGERSGVRNESRLEVISSIRTQRYGYCKNLKKMVKTGQTRTPERKSTQRTGKIDSRKVKCQP